MERIKSAVEKARQARHPISPLVDQVISAGLAPSTAVHRGLVPARTAILEASHLERHRIVALDASHPSRWAFDLLRTQVLQRMTDKGWKTLAVTSPTVSSGKTVVAINLAMSIAHHPQHSAVLVDFDLRRPRVGSYLGLQQAPSLEAVLNGSLDLSHAAVDIGVPNFCVIPTSKPVKGASEALTSDKAAQITSEFRSTDSGQITIFDLPPVTAVDDVIAVLPRIDCVLLVVGNGMSTKREIEEAQRHLARYNLIGTVLNKATAPVRDAGYY